MFPNALKATRKLSPRTAPLSPNTALKNKVATVVPELTRSYLNTEVLVQLERVHRAETLLINDHGALTCGEVCHVGKNVEYIDSKESQKGVLPQGLDRVLEKISLCADK